MTRILGIGECMIEMAPTGEGTFAMGFAGDTFNTCWYARRLAGPELRVGYLTAVGDDDPSRRMEEFMRDAGVEPEFTVRPGGSVGLYMISLKDGERSFSYWRSTSAARTLADDLEVLPDMTDGDVALVSGITLAILPEAGRTRLLEVLHDARKRGVRVAFDPNIRPKLWESTETMRRWVMAAARVCDIALPSHEDEATHFGDADASATADRYAGAGAGLVVVKDGADPVVIRTPDSRETITPARVTEVVDTTAAGDAFNGAFLVALLEGAEAAQAAKAGCALSARVIAARGALVPV
ncbi:sugar kinase [Allosediminivita pacifica]|uniref:2-keto-3-deoxygluconate kinase n=1 Tax=Allosediminivita pacifica TaxID=1267769 RepID=A0A2T6AQ02_9RHOB|nr:sugar kinase [Allosediminivita pacifica]PTX45899.1 2-keto-3-deoxygluconate kinase [Allosediminivita pacifica]GGB19259.1 2-dehydro-3-deoxygluconokinase [Allosediminivita pacifica]